MTDLAVQGNGFFVVQSSNGTPALTRAGSFVPNAAGNLVNSAGYSLLGYNLTDGSSATANGTSGLEVVNLSNQELTASPSTAGTLPFNVSSNATTVTGDTPATNAADSTYTSKTSVAAYDNLGNQVTLDIYLTKTGTDANGNSTWQATTYNQADASAGDTFPYSTGPLSNQTLTYSNTTGKLLNVDGATTPLDLSVPIPNGKTLAIDVSQSTQVASDFSVSTSTVNGSAPSKLDHVTIGTDGTVTSVYANGVQQATYRIPLADVPSEDNLTQVSGNVYEPSVASGGMTISTAGSGSLGQIESSSLENSTVDLATELTNMISAQRSYEANSKVIQAASDMLKVVDQLSG